MRTRRRQKQIRFFSMLKRKPIAVGTHGEGNFKTKNLFVHEPFPRHILPGAPFFNLCVQSVYQGVVGGEKELENVEVFARECTQRSCRSCCVCRFELKITQDCNETLRESWEDSFWWLWDHHWHCLCERKTRDVVCLRQKRVWRCTAFGWT